MAGSSGAWGCVAGKGQWHPSPGEAKTLVSSMVCFPHCLGLASSWGAPVESGSNTADFGAFSGGGDDSLHTRLFSESLARATGHSGGTKGPQHVVGEQGLCCMI